MIETLTSLWNNYSFYILVGLCILFILGVSAVRKISKKKGTWKDGFGMISVGKDNIPLTSSSRRDSLGEKICKQTLERIFGRPFRKERPSWLKNTVTSYNLEMDVYNPELKLACEYQGRQHYEYIPFFHKNKEAFLNQQYRDDMKRRILRDNGIRLLEVPYSVKPENIEMYIRGKLIGMGYRF